MGEYTEAIGAVHLRHTVEYSAYTARVERLRVIEECAQVVDADAGAAVWPTDYALRRAAAAIRELAAQDD